MTMFSIYFTHRGFISIEILPERGRFNSAFFALINFLSIFENESMLRSKMRAQGYWLHIDNAKLHYAALSLQKTEEMGFTRLLSLPYSSDLAPYDFFLFEYLKKN
jgi:hypothetical protein